MNWRSERRLALLVSAALALVCLTAAAVEKEPAVRMMTLAECIQEALARNPGLSAETARTSAADYAAEVARAGRFPRIDLSSDYSYSDRPQRLMQPSYQGELLRYENDIAQAVAEVRVPLFSGGRLVARQRAAELAAAASRFNLFGSRQDLILNVTAAYLAATEQQAIIDAIDGSLKALIEKQKVAGTMKDVGRIAPLDLLKVDVRVAAVEQRRSKSGRDRDLISLHLAVLLGRDLGESLPSVAGLPALPQPETSGMDQMVSEAAARRPELNALLQEIARRQAELTQVSAERWPSLEAFGRWTARSAVFPTDTTISSFQDFFLGGLTLKVPLWTSGELGARRRQAQALLKEARERRRAGLLQVAEQVRREVAAQAEAVDREHVAGKAAEQAREAFGIEQANYDLGRASVNDVLDAQAALLEAEMALAQARHDVALATISLVWASGRDLEQWLLPGKREEQ